MSAVCSEIIAVTDLKPVIHKPASHDQQNTMSCTERGPSYASTKILL